MKYYFKKFSKVKISEKSDSYVWLLYFIYCALIDSEHSQKALWDCLKSEINEFKFGNRSISKIKKAATYILRENGESSTVKNLLTTSSKIQSIQIKNFRGFGSEFNDEDKGVRITFNENNTIFYGPNGSGKSSLCDALEFGLTGDVREAVRRNRKVKDYIKRLGVSNKPDVSIFFTNSELNATSISSEQKNYYSQAFIEKNRIHEFTHFGSKDTGVKKEHILSILIGMDDLSELSKSFVQSPSFKTNLEGFKRRIIADKIEGLNTENTRNITLRTSFLNAIAESGKSAKALVEKEDVTLKDLEDELTRLTKSIESKNREIVELSTINLRQHDDDKLKESTSLIEKQLITLKKLREEINNAKVDISFSKLYSAVIELTQTIDEKCPVCDTPLKQTSVNPIEKASEELKSLENVKTLEEQLITGIKEVNDELDIIKIFHNDFLINLKNYPVLIEKIPNKLPLKLVEIEFDLNHETVISDGYEAYKSSIDYLGDYFSLVKDIISKQSTIEKTIEGLNSEITSLNNRKTKCETIRSSWQNSLERLEEIKPDMESYNSRLKELEKLKIEEDKYNSLIDELISVYPNFYKDFQSFKDGEFKTRFGKLESEIAVFYTQINQHDENHELIEKFYINNTGSDYKIEFKLKGVDKKEDASIKFSEGHLRSLGLSILLANAKINELPFIIFDDVVNAIDSDHRSNIIQMMVKDDYLNKIQQIVSTHDRLYWERFSLENQNFNYDSYVLKNTNSGVVHYHYKLSFKEKIQQALKFFDIRQALLYCRIWFETIAKQFCMENNIELKGQLKPNNFNVSIAPTLGAVYRVLKEKLGENSNLQILHQDEINYKGINQEAHSFDEYNFNFIHSRTSLEVEKIFKAVIGLQSDIEFLKHHEAILGKLLEAYTLSLQKVQTLNPRMRLEVQLEILKRYDDNKLELLGFTERMQSLGINEKLVEKSRKLINQLFVFEIISQLEKSKLKHADS